jgi:Cu+-exporting ATPase
MINYDVKISGMSCASCALTIETNVLKIRGVDSSSVNFAVESGAFKIQNEEIKKEINIKIKELGYEVVKTVEAGPSTQKNNQNLFKFTISIALSAIIFFLAMWPLSGWPNQIMNWYLQLALCTPIWIWVGFKFQKSLFSFLITGRSGMNTLIGLGTSAAYIYSSFVTIFNSYSISIGLTQAVYFEAIGFIISFVYLGQYFEDKAKRKTKEALNLLFKLSSKNATIFQDAKLIEVPIEKVKVNDILRVKPGEKIPVDGVVVKGESSVDESMISGEPIPVTKDKGMKLYAGTINGESILDFKATSVGSSTFLSQIINFVEKAQGSKPEIQKYADRISSVFTPVVILISVIVFVLWFFVGPEPVWGNSISNLIAVLVIACPCALGLATPTAVVVATGNASLKGLLIGGGDVIEKAVEIDTIIFDKTGTITEGKPSVIEVEFIEGSIGSLGDIASIENLSEHPISKAIVNYVKDQNLKFADPDDFQVIKGKGITAKILNKEYFIGNQSLLEDFKVDLDKNLTPTKVGSFVYISLNKKHIGTIVVGDKIKATSAQTIANFKKQGIETWMITGDNEIVAESVSKEIGIDHFVANALPIEKSEYVVKLQKEGKKVAMIGDGINDAPALSKANLSMAMGTGTDVAINASDVTIVKGDLARVVDFLNLSKGTMKIIKQNLFLSIVYNALLIPIAGGLLYVFGGPLMPPVLASIAMALSSISVVSNSLRIKKLI